MEDIGDIGLVFGGGGGKGAYQIGVWKTFQLYGLDKYVKAVSGTSVGALNAVLFALGDYDKAQNIWEEITPSDLLAPKNFFDNKNGLFSRAGLEKIIDSLDLEQLKYSKIDVYVSYKNIDYQKVFSHIKDLLFPFRNLKTYCPLGPTPIEYKVPRYFSPMERSGNIAELLENFWIAEVQRCKINLMTPRQIKDIILASSAMPIIYESILINNQKCFDAGVTSFGNIPIEPLYKNNIKNMFIIPLDHKFNIEKIKASHWETAAIVYRDCNLVTIKPSKDLGDFFKGTLDFKQASIKDRIDVGEYDALKTLRDAWIKSYL